jgi:hypothetical protein
VRHDVAARLLLTSRRQRQANPLGPSVNMAAII